jgi:transcriptional regulator GlxA family with amidase domain
MRQVAIAIFDEVEVLDFAGPFEVFGVCGRRSGPVPFEVYTIAEGPRPVIARNGLSVNPMRVFDDASARADIVLVPGGFGTRREMRNPAMLQWVRRAAADAELVLSVCTGALILGSAELQAAAPTCVVRRDMRYVDSGRIITSAGVSAGIDMSLHVVARLLGDDAARETARYMEYEGTFDSAARESAALRAT